MPSDEVLRASPRRSAPLEPVDGPARGNGPAAYHRLAGAAGTIGVITPMTHTYCGSCNRVRLTADGRLRTCLFGDHEVDLRTPLRAGVPLEPFVRRRSPRSRRRTRCSRVASADCARSRRSGDSIEHASVDTFGWTSNSPSDYRTHGQ